MQSPRYEATMKDSIRKKLQSVAIAMTTALWLCAASATAQTTEFPYPSLPDTLREPQARADYLLLHYWDHVDFADSTLLYSQTYGEQAFVNYIDLLGRFGKNVGAKSAQNFIDKAWSRTVAKRRFDSLIDHYLESGDSPLRNNRTYLLLLNAITHNSHTDATERERYLFRAQQAAVNLPGDTARNFTFVGDDGRKHSIRDYRGQRVCLFFYDPDCENCHTTWAWMQAHPLPADIKVLRIKVNDTLYSLYAIKATPTLYLLDRDNIVVRKDCTPEELLQAFK